MKQVLLIGKFNEVTKQIREGLSQHCQVQLCADSEEIAEGMLRLMKPDMVILSLVGSIGAHAELFALLDREVYQVPVIVIGSDENEVELTGDGYLPSDRITFLRRPIKLEAVIERARNTLDGIEETAAVPEKLDDRLRRGPRSVLVVDDDPTLLRTMQGMLSKRYQTLFATSGPQALVTAAKSKPDIILLDYEMPVCNGKMTLEMLRAEPETRDIPVVFLTGMSLSDHVHEVVSLKPQGYILKPPTEAKIVETIEQVFKEGAQAAWRNAWRAAVAKRKKKH